MLIKYIERQYLKKKTLALIEQANEIIDEYEAEGYSLTLRQLYYQFVARGLLPNTMKNYKNLGSIINDGRLLGLISWKAIEDRTRNLERVSTWRTPNDILQSCAECFKIDLWQNQENYVEVWIEKEALVGVVEPVCNKWRVPFFACRGYSSQSEQWEAGQRLINQINNDKRVHILHFGDHDPSGIDMTRDNDDRLKMFINHEVDADRFQIHRLALNIDQVKKHKPPPNPAKIDDSRFASYERKYGKMSWELDALEPKLISSLIETNVREFINFETWCEDESTEENYIAKLAKLAKGKY